MRYNAKEHKIDVGNFAKELARRGQQRAVNITEDVIHMIEIKETQLESLLDRTIDELKHSKDSFRIFSMTKAVDNRDALDFFQAAKVLQDQRIFWSSTIDQFYMVGIGQVHCLKSEDNTIGGLQKAWDDALAQATIHDTIHQPGTGLTALGGMAFDPLKKKTALWEKFADQALTIPAFVFTKTGDQCYLTCNLKLKKADNSRQLAAKIKEKEHQLFSNAPSFSLHDGILSKKEIAPEQWKRTVEKATQAIKNDTAQKIVLAREMRLEFSGNADVGVILQRLLKTQPNSYVFAIEHGNDCFMGATPERLVKLAHGKLLSTCLAGTAPRGIDKDADDRIGSQLLNDPKNRQEHDFVVQMIKKAVTPYAKNIVVPKKPELYKLRNLQHLYTPVTADLLEKSGIFPIVEKLHPTPALGGTPREASLAFIRENELLDRGWYGAPVGWLDGQNNGEFAVAIRSGLIQGKEASLFAGCGVVADSNPEDEYAETNIKFMPMLSVLEGETK